MRKIATAIGVAIALVLGGVAPTAGAAVAGDWQFDHEILPGTFNQPVDIARDAAGYLYVADPADHRIVKISPAGSVAGTFGSEGTGDGQFGSGGPAGVALDSSGNVFALDPAGYRVEKFAGSGAFLSRFGTMGNGNGQFSLAAGVTTDAAGDVFVSDRTANRVQKFSNTGVWIAAFGSAGSGPGQLHTPLGMTVDQAGKVYVADYGNGRIQVFSPQSGTSYAFDRQIGTLGSGVENLAGPTSVKLDATGNLYIADLGADRVQVYSPQGNFLSVIANAKTPAPGTDLGTESVVIDGSGTAWTTDIGLAANQGKVLAYRQFTTPTFTLAPDPVAPLGQPYSSAVGATAFPVPSYSLTGGTLPTGLTLATTGGITGTPTAPGVFTATITATTPYASATTTVTITVTGGTAPGTVVGATRGTVAISGTPAIGHSVRAAPKGWAPGTTFAYQWTRSGKPIAGSTSATRHLTKSDLDKKIAVVVTSGTLTATSKPVTAGHAFKKLGKPRVHGTAEVGKTLRVIAGAWSPKPHTSVRWYRDGAPIAKATKAHYVVKKADAGHRIRVKVTATRKHYATTTRTSVHTARVKSR